MSPVLSSLVIGACAFAAGAALVQGKDIDGQVFIVTRAGPAIKLALVQVAAFSKAEIEKHVADTDIHLAPERSKADSAAKRALEELQHAEHGVSGGFGKWMMSLQKTQAKDPTGQSWADPRTEALRYNALKDRIPKLRACFDEARARQIQLNSAAPYFVDLSAPVSTAKTDADGRFKLTVPDEQDIALLASSSRTILDRVERYFWVVRLAPHDTSITLSNDNLTTSGSEDSLLKTSE